MTEIRVADDGGDEMTLWDVDGLRYPPLDENQTALLNLPSVSLRPDDILICAYPKSGTHWVYEIIRLLVAGELDENNVSKGETMMEFVREEVYKDSPSPRILNSHVLFRNLPRDISEKKSKIIRMTRNPKDMAVSFYNFYRNLPEMGYSGQWTNYMKPLMLGKFDYGSWFDYTRDWESVMKTSDVPILSLFYEDMKEDPIREAKKICAFLELERSEVFVKAVCERCNFTKLKEVKKSHEMAVGVYRKGQVGDWKNWFTVAQNEWFDQLYQEKMKDCPLNIRFTLDSDQQDT